MNAWKTGYDKKIKGAPILPAGQDESISGSIKQEVFLFKITSKLVALIHTSASRAAFWIAEAFFLELTSARG